MARQQTLSGSPQVTKLCGVELFIEEKNSLFPWYSRVVLHAYFIHILFLFTFDMWPKTALYIVGQKNVALYFCLYLLQLLADFTNFFTAALCGQFAIMWLLYIPPHRKCIFTLFCET